MNELENMRHTLSHVLAAAVKELYPDVKFGIGPAIDNGFYYDIDFGSTKLSDTDLPKIEKKMRELIARKLPMTKRSISRTDALKWAKDNNQDYKVELIEDLPEDEEVTFYDLGDVFVDHIAQALGTGFGRQGQRGLAHLLGLLQGIGEHVVDALGRQ